LNSRTLLVFALAFVVSLAVMVAIRVPNSGVGSVLIDMWRSERTLYLFNTSRSFDINSAPMIVEQTIAFGLFLSVIAATVLNMEWRIGAVLIALAVSIALGLAPPQAIIERAIDWRLIFFLIGSMTFAGILRRLGVFTYIAMKILELSRGRASVFLLILGLISTLLAAVLDEATSIIYMVTLILELRRFLRIDVKPLIIFSVLATNVGSIALPIGNPIGIYLAFQAGIPVSVFVRICLPLALIASVMTTALFAAANRGYYNMLRRELEERRRAIEAYVVSRYTALSREELAAIKRGLVLLMVFVVLVSTVELSAKALSSATLIEEDPHALLSIIPYVLIALAVAATELSLHEVSKTLEAAVEWPSLVFFMGLFSLAYILNFTGVTHKLAYLIASVSTPGTAAANLIIGTVMFFGSAVLSSVLDNLSVIVTLTGPTTMLTSVGLSKAAFLALLYGGVFGGNYTPVGSTANIIAVSLAEKEKIKIGWGEWLRLALVATSLQIVAAELWLLMALRLGITW